MKSRIQSALKKKESRQKANGQEKVGRARRSRGRNGADGESDGQLGELSLPKELSNAKPRFIEPMKPRLVDAPPTHGDWLYELKFDGIRLLAIKDGKKVKLISRNKNDLDATLRRADRFTGVVTGEGIRHRWRSGGGG